MGELMAKNDESNLSPDRALEFCTRVKLCCLAEKYGVLLLHNICTDSLAEFLYSGSNKNPLLCWEVFRECFLYVYNHSAEGSGLRRLFCTHFCNMLACSEDICESTYHPEQMLSLATEIPDLMSDFFRIMHQNRTLTVETAPWNTDPCVFHIHPQPQNQECPRALGGVSSFKWPDIEARLHYYLQCRLMEGQRFVSTTSIAYFLDLKLQDLISAGQFLIDDGANVVWANHRDHLGIKKPKGLVARAGGDGRSLSTTNYGAPSAKHMHFLMAARNLTTRITKFRFA